MSGAVNGGDAKLPVKLYYTEAKACPVLRAPDLTFSDAIKRSKELAFFKYHSDIHVPRLLLRELLSESDVIREQTTSTHGLIAFGTARNEDQSYPCVAVVHASTPDILQITPYKTRDTRFVHDEGTFNASRPQFMAEASVVREFGCTLKVIEFVPGFTDDHLLVQSTSHLFYSGVQYERPKKNMQLSLEDIFKWNSGRNQILCATAYRQVRGTALACVDTGNTLRIWLSASPEEQSFQLTYRINLSVISKDIKNVVARPNDLLVHCRNSIDKIDPAMSELRTIWRASDEETILQIEVCKHSSEVNGLVGLLTSQRVLLLDTGASAIIASWPHQLCQTPSLYLTITSEYPMTRIFLLDRTSTLCMSFDVTHFSEKKKRHKSYILSLPGSDMFSEMRTMPVIPTNGPAIFWFLACVKDVGVVASYLAVIASTRTAKPLDELFSSYIKDKTPVAQQYDFRKLYKSLLKNEVTEKTRSSSERLKLGHEIEGITRLMKRTETDESLARMMEEHIEGNKYTATVKGIVRETDRGLISLSTSQDFVEAMQPWRGLQCNSTTVPTHGRPLTTYSAIQQAAASLAQSAAVFSDQTEHKSTPVLLSDFCKFKGTKPSRALKCICDEWVVGQDVEEYEWVSMNTEDTTSRQRKPRPPIRSSALSKAPPTVMSYSQTQQLATQMQAPESTQSGMPVFSATQPMPGKFGGDLKRKKKKAGF